MATTEVWDDAVDTGLSKEKLPDGEFEMKILSWAGRAIDKGEQRGRVVKLKFEIVTAPEGGDQLVGQQFDYDEFLTRTVGKQIFFKSLKDVGFDVDSWVDTAADGEFTKGRMLPLALKYLKLNGTVLRVKKWTQDGKYANLRMVGRAGEASVIPNADVMAVDGVLEKMEDAF